VGDFTGDGKADLVGRWAQTGQWWLSASNGTAFATNLWARWAGDSPSLSWVDAQVGDLNGDGKADLIARWKQTGQWWASLSGGTTAASTALWAQWAPDSSGLSWVDVRLGDLNGDGKADLVARIKQTGQWWASLSAGATAAGTTMWAQWAPDSAGLSWVDIQLADFNGDGKADLAARLLQNGQWWVAVSTGAAFSTSQWATWSPAVTWVDVHAGHFV
jgi:hypothetical protein